MAVEAGADLYSMCSQPSSLLSDVEQKTESFPRGVLRPPVETADFRPRTCSNRLSGTGCEIGVSAAMMLRLFAGDKTVLCLACRRVNVSESEAGGSGKEKARRSRLTPVMMGTLRLSVMALPPDGMGTETVPATVGSARSAGRTSGDFVGETLSRRSFALSGELYIPAGNGDVKGAEVVDDEAPWSAVRHASEQ